jgi:hypothetical protein
MELKRFIKGSWEVHHNGRYKGQLTDYGKGYAYQPNDKPHPITIEKEGLKKEELKQLLEGMLQWDAYEVYSEYKARLRGFKIKG